MWFAELTYNHCPALTTRSTNDPICMMACRGKQAILHVYGDPLVWPEPGDWQVARYPDERALLQGILDHINDEDPDVLTGYNLARFDLPRLVLRCKTLGLKADFSRLVGEEVRSLDVTNVSNQAGSRSNTLNDCPGRIILDALVITRAGMDKLRSYKLKAVAKFYELECLKDDVEYSEIYDLFHGSAEDRGRLVKYCAKDVDVTQALINKRMMVYDIVAQSQVKYLRARDVLTRGQNYSFARAIRAEKAFRHLVADYQLDEVRRVDVASRLQLTHLIRCR